MTKILKNTIVRLNVAKCFTNKEGGELEYPLETYGNDKDGTVHSSRPITQDERNAWYDSPRSHGLNSAGETRLAPRSVSVMLHRDRTYTVLRARTAAQLGYGNKTGGLTKIFCAETGEETYVKTALIEVVPDEPNTSPFTLLPDSYGNTKATVGFDRCECGCKHWEADRCVDCGNAFGADSLASDDWAEEAVEEEAAELPVSEAVMVTNNLKSFDTQDPSSIREAQKVLAKVVLPWAPDSSYPPKFVRANGMGEQVAIVTSWLGGFGDAHGGTNGWGYKSCPDGDGRCTSGIEDTKEAAMAVIDTFLAEHFPSLTVLPAMVAPRSEAWVDEKEQCLA